MAAYTLANVLRNCAQHISPALIFPDALAHNFALAEQMPLNLTEAIGFEAFLDGASPSESGFALNVMAGSFGWAMLAGERGGLPDSLFTHVEWVRLRRLIAAVQDPASPFYERLSNVWLEFDVTRPNSLIPDLFVGMKGRLSNPDLPHEGIVGRLAEALTGAPPYPPLLAKYHACIAALPVTASANQIGIMLGRPVHALRLVSTFSDPHDTAAYLNAIGWGMRSEGKASAVLIMQG